MERMDWRPIIGTRVIIKTERIINYTPQTCCDLGTVVAHDYWISGGLGMLVKMDRDWMADMVVFLPDEFELEKEKI